jgi:hypothetical protein
VIHGTSTLLLTYDWQLAIRGMDSAFEADKQTVKRLVRKIAKEKDWRILTLA